MDLGSDDFSCRLRREPLGVVAAITPWNYPRERQLLLCMKCCSSRRSMLHSPLPMLLACDLVWLLSD